jgi:broad specificity phosphatase PhoE
MIIPSRQVALLLGAAIGTVAVWYHQTRRKLRRREEKSNAWLIDALSRRERLPQLVILVRHGESQGNADHTLFRTIPDNLVSLTDLGMEQAANAGRRIEDILELFNIRRVHLIVSPFERTLQTAARLRESFEHRIVRTELESRIREQEFGNLQGENLQEYRDEQKRVGRFWYRFPTGESGTDVYDRVKSWWHESVANVNLRVGYEYVDALVIVTHGLTMRFTLMQLFSWSPTTFHSVWNAGNCDVYVLRKDLSKAGIAPYVLDDKLGDKPKSSIEVAISFRSSPSLPKVFVLNDYLSIPPPRTIRMELVKQKLAEQYPTLDVSDIESIKFMPFTEGGVVVGRTSSGVAGSSFVNIADALNKQLLSSSKRHQSDTNRHHAMKRAQPEMSCRFPNVESAFLNPS